MKKEITKKEFNFLINASKLIRRGKNPTPAIIRCCHLIITGEGDKLNASERARAGAVILSIKKLKDLLDNWPETIKDKVLSCSPNSNEETKRAAIDFLSGKCENATQAAVKNGCATASVNHVVFRLESMEGVYSEYLKMKGLKSCERKDTPVLSVNQKINKLSSHLRSESVKRAFKGLESGEYKTAFEAAEKNNCHVGTVKFLKSELSSFDRFAIEYNKLLQ